MDSHPRRYGFQVAEKRETPESVSDYQTLMREGYVILERLLDAATCAASRAESARLIGGSGRNSFAGLDCVGGGEPRRSSARSDAQSGLELRTFPLVSPSRFFDRHRLQCCSPQPIFDL